MLENLVGANIARAVGDENNLTEIRMRISRPLTYCTVKGERKVAKAYGSPYVVSQKDIDDVLMRATNMSVYSASDEMKKGYIPFGSYRIGIGGEGVSDDGKLLAMKNVSYLVVRIPHQIKHVADEIVCEVMSEGVLSTLVISPTGAGKTTMLRELARLASKDKNVVIIDERYELCAVSHGAANLDVGDCEIVSGVPKVVAYENCIRAMNPDVIVTDELFSPNEVAAICDVVRCGVRVFASVHGESVEKVLSDSRFSPLAEAFDFAVSLSKSPIGKIVEKVRL